MRILNLCIAMLAAVTVVGCASGLGGGDYERAEARRVISVRMGIVESVRPVKLEGTKSPVGTLGGAAVGGIAGSTIGQGKGAAIGAVLGAVAGGLAGSAAEEGITRKQGIEVTVKMDNGEMLAVVQEDGGEKFMPGERIRLLQDGRTTRVTR
ncbi:MAG TPA: glycine zipper 2TM domain-containing protein [Zoogloea sp.]|jgi:outer membrane lipoprotein SlyB|uniref:glycine zipper 2TM domain-containing protein n=1 Tax=Zoogloea sp. TaxID=49181 RepID=UPI002C14B256|nr:glycine zipper 2TM domain-containing protein [Zoogloea sp.]HOB45778.1 glycine zipper 2TM domain-containing protein [Zoogloea sp.]HQA10037.1 glycine zipper 2TM domain-containing protein [Zoogloea sp.]HQE38656.1 glycine zipper 2TM domain-containing protein [Zoogloea sp.]